MSLTVDFSSVDDVLIATSSGELDEETDELLDRRVARECDERGYRKVIIDLRLTGGETTPLGLFRSGSNLEERGFAPGMRLAFVDRPEYRDANEMYELVAGNRGFLVRHFAEMEGALAWLAG